MDADIKALTEATSGAFGGVLSTTILYPLDTCKTKFQAEANADGPNKYRCACASPDCLRLSGGEIRSFRHAFEARASCPWPVLLPLTSCAILLAVLSLLPAPGISWTC